MGCLSIIIGVIISMLLGAVLIGICGAMFLDTPWGTGWDAAWDHPWRLGLFVFLLAPIFAGGRFSD